VDNNEDFISSGPWDDDSFGDHVDEGHAYSDVEETLSLINQPRQVCFLFHSFTFKVLVSHFPLRDMIIRQLCSFFVCLLYCYAYSPRIVLGLKDRRRRPEGGVNGSQSKFLQWNLAYIPKPTRGPSFLTRPRLISYGQAISLRKRTRIYTGDPEWCRCDHVRDRQHQSTLKTVYLLSDISPNTWRACSRNYLRRPI
jgi:hypothetical protein